MPKARTVLTAAAAFLLTSGLAFAQQPGQKAPLQRADTNQDGQVTFAEAQAAAPGMTRERFDKLDRDGDGVLTKADAKQPAPPAMAQEKPFEMPQGEALRALLDRADTNNDDKVTMQELSAVAPRVAKRGFQQLDKNKDGVISKADFPANADAPAGANQAIVQRLRAADADKDGRFSFAEIQAVAPRITEQLFQNADLDKDGYLIQSEARKLAQGARPQQRAQRPNAGAGKVRADMVAKLLELDADQSGDVTYAEVVAAKPGFPRNAFDRNDTNKDGVISQADLN